MLLVKMGLFVVWDMCKIAGFHPFTISQYLPITLPKPSAKCQHYLEGGASTSFAVKKKRGSRLQLLQGRKGKKGGKVWT